MHRKRTIEEAKAILAEQKQSGLTQQEFCHKRKIPMTTFSSFKKRVAKQKPSKFSQVQRKSFSQYQYCFEARDIKLYFDNILDIPQIIRAFSNND